MPLLNAQHILIIPDLIGILTVIINLMVLGFGICRYKKFLSDKSKEKQLDVVINLIDCIHIDKNCFIDCNQYTKPITYIHPLNIFEISDNRFFNDTKNDDRELYFFNNGDNPTALRWGFFNDFYTNPCLPNKIAIELYKFKLPQIELAQKMCSKLKVVSQKDCVVIGNIGVENEDAEVFSVNGFDSKLKTVRDFKEACSQLNTEIIEWLRKYGIKDLNITNPVRR